jgi:hypothetical protein
MEEDPELNSPPAVKAKQKLKTVLKTIQVQQQATAAVADSTPQMDSNSRMLGNQQHLPGASSMCHQELPFGATTAPVSSTHGSCSIQAVQSAHILSSDSSTQPGRRSPPALAAYCSAARGLLLGLLYPQPATVTWHAPKCVHAQPACLQTTWHLC